MTQIESTPEIDALIDAHAPIAIGVSGGKDSQAAALATFDYLNSRGHSGARILIHSDLGVTEWNESLPVCERLAAYLNCELVILKRKSGDMMDRWESRWASSIHRYINLKTVTLVLPWSTPALRFCTSELKTHLIEAELKRRFKGQSVINVTGVRRDESAARAKGTIASKSKGIGWNWRPISDWKIDEVFARIAASGLHPHEAYSKYGMSRVSCRFCIMSNLSDMVAASAQKESHELYRRMVDLEIASTFAFQGSRWLGDIAPHLLDKARIDGIALAKQKAFKRVALEKLITKDMLYVKGWPTRMLTDAEAEILAAVRAQVSSLMGFKSKYLSVQDIHGRYAELMEINRLRLIKKSKHRRKK